jgi:hypothetical protein
MGMEFTSGFGFGRCNPLLATSFAETIVKAPFCHQKRGFKAEKGSVYDIFYIIIATC